jgi:hypothetical protein
MAGVALVYVVAAVALPAEVSHLGDGSVKAVQARSLLATGFRSQSLVEPWPEVHPDGAYFPLAPPFAYRQGDRFVPSFLPAFAAASAPFFAAFGWQGLRVLPIVAGVALVALVARMARALGFAPRAAAALGAFVALGTPVAFYAVQLWELVPFAALVAGGVGLALESVGEKADARRALIGGAIVGASTALREEALVFAAAVALGLALVRGPARAWIAGAVAAAAIVLAWNFATTGHLLGFHALQLATPLARGDWTDRLANRLVIAFVQLELLIAQCPFFVLPLVLAFKRGAAGDARLRVLRVAVAASIAVIVVVAPNVGGSSWGPRYLVGAVPLGAVLAAATLRAALATAPRPVARALGVAGAIVVAWGLVASALGGRALARELAEKRALLNAVRSARPDAILTANIWVAQNLGALWFDVPVLRVEGQEQVGPALETLHAVGRARVLMIRWPESGTQALLAPGARAHREDAWMIGPYALERWRL